MKDVAAELGVSVTTISKVLNNHADIGEATRQRVLAKVEELGYRRNAVARSLTLRRTHTLGVIVSDLMHSFFVEVVTAIEESLGRQGYGLLLCNLGEDPAKERWQLEMLLERQVDGVILASTNAQKNGDLLRQLQSQGKGLVLIDRDDHQGLRCHRVVTDDEQVGRLATSHLISLGHRHIAHLSGPRLVHARRRQRGYLAAMRQAGLPVMEPWVVDTGFVEKDGYDATVRLLSQRPGGDGAVCRERPHRHRRDEGGVGSRPPHARGSGHRRRRRHRARRHAPRPADDGELVARGSGPSRRALDSRPDRAAS